MVRAIKSDRKNIMRKMKAESDGDIVIERER